MREQDKPREHVRSAPSAARAGLAGAVVFSFTDDWWRGGRQIEDWNMGLTTRERLPKESFQTTRKIFSAATSKLLVRNWGPRPLFFRVGAFCRKWWV